MKLKITKYHAEHTHDADIERITKEIIPRRFESYLNAVKYARERKSDGIIYVQDARQIYWRHIRYIINSFIYFEIYRDEMFQDIWTSLNRLMYEMPKKEYLKLVEAICNEYKDLEWEK